MAKYNKNNNTRNTTSDKSAAPRIAPITKTLPVVVTGVDNRGNQYDPSQVFETIELLQNCNVFDILSVGVSMAKSVCFNNEDLKGQISVARIKSYDVENTNMEVIFIGKNTEFAAIADDMIIAPRIRLKRDGTVDSILSFDIIRATEA